jgi:holliday junction DNA helicase RuvA
VIGWLRGRVVHVDAAGTMVLDVNGVGYEVSVASGGELRAGDETEVFVHTQVRADAIVLYGFATRDDREFFSTLLVTPGVGPSTALAALRTMTTGELREAIEVGDLKRVAQIPGVGAKTASRIVLELKGRLVEMANPPVAPKARASDIEEALRSLGYGPSEIREALEGVSLPEDESAALRVALRQLGRR